MANARDYAAIAGKAMAAHRPFLPLEFHPAAVAALDAFIDVTWGEEGAAPEDDRWFPSDGRSQAIIGLGAFFGELLRREFGGRWRDDPEYPDNPIRARVVLTNGLEIFAIGKVYKRLKNGGEDRIEPFYLWVRQELGRVASPAEAEGWLRQARYFQRAGRPDLADRFCARALECSPEPLTRAAVEELRAQALEKARAESEAAQASAAAEAAAGARARIDGLADEGRRALVARGVRVDLAALTLIGLDTLLDETFGREPVKDAQRQPRLELALGAFVGERLCACYRGQWRAQPGEAVAGSQVVWPSGLASCPFEIVSRRLAQGAEAGVLAQVAALVKELCAKGDAEDPPERAADWLAQADDYAQKVGRFDLAVRHAKIGLRLGGDSASARLKLVSWHRALGQLDAAAANLAAALQLAPAGALAHRETGLVALLRGAPQDALAAFERSLALEPANGEALLGKAKALLALGRVTEAREWLEMFPGRGDCEPERSVLAAQAADATGDRVAAHSLFDRIKEHPRLSADERARAAARVLELAGDKAVRLAAVDGIGDLEQAVAAYARFSADHPDVAEAWRERGVGLSMLGRIDDALACLRRAAELEPSDPRSYDHEAVALARLNRIDEALAALDRGLKACPRAGVLLARKGIFLSTAGRDEEALVACDEALAADPAYAESWAFKGNIEQRLGRTQDAIASLERYLAARPGSREKRVEVARRQLWGITHPGRSLDRDRARRCEDDAFARMQAGALAEALVCFDAAVEADPLFDEVWFNRAGFLQRLSRFDEAVACLQKAEELAGPTSHVTEALTACLFRLGRGEEALQACDRLLARQPGSPEAVRGRARALVRLGRAAESLPLYQRLLARQPDDATLAGEREEALRLASVQPR